MIDAAAAVGEGILAVLFFGTGLWLARQASRAPTRGFRVLAWAAAATCAVSTAAALQRMGDEAVQNGWLPASVGDILWGPWEAVQVVVSLAVLVWVATALARYWLPLGRAERMVHVLTGRLPDEVDIAGGADLSPREREVLGLIGEGHLSDDELAAVLFIAPSTAATHVQRLLRKTGLHSRKDLILAANAGRLRLRGPAERTLPPLAVRLRRATTELRGGEAATHGNGRARQAAKGGPGPPSST